jgi:thioredoxin reductase (NADPH)
LEEVIIVGAGPCGLSAGVECQAAGLNPLILEKGCVVNSIYQYPTFMTFFSTPELLEIGGMPFMTEREKPTRSEALNYYRTVAQRKQLRIRTYEEVKEIERKDGCFTVHTETMHGDRHTYETRNVVIATGYFDNPNRLEIPGEDLPKVYYQYKEAHPFHGTRVAIIGGQNSAVDAAMELQRIGADVTIVYRGAKVSEKVKPWIRPIFEGMIAKGKIRMLFNSRVIEIKQRTIVVETEQDGRVEVAELENDFVLKLIGYRPDRDFLQRIGVEVNEETTAPVFDPETMETGVPGIYIAGVIAAGREANEIFIENGRGHGALIARHIVSKKTSV